MSTGLGIVLAVLWLAVALAALIWGTVFFTRLLGEEECLPPGSFWPWLLVSGAAASFVAWHIVGLRTALLPLAYAVPVLGAAVWALHLRLAERKARTRGFGWRDGRLLRLADRTGLAPTFFEENAQYFSTGPVSGYCLYSIELHDATGAIGRNGYVHPEAVRRDVDRLLRDGCRTLDAVVVWQALPTVLYSVHLGVWTELLCGRLHTVPEDSARFWRRWIRPEFPGDGSAELAASELRAHVGPLVAEDHRSGQRLVALLDIAGPTILMMTERALRAFEDGIRGPNGRGIVEFESGLAKTTFVRGRRSPRRRGVRIE